MGLFVLGVFFGWLLEWLFVKFVMRTDLAPQNEINSSNENIEANNKAEFEATSKKITKSSAIRSNNAQDVNPNNVEAKSTKNQTKNKAKKAKFESGDDFTRLTGIGPKITLALHSVGITSFEQLSNTKDEQLQKMLEGTDVKIINKEIVTTWNEQALLANQAKWSELETLQSSIKNK